MNVNIFRSFFIRVVIAAPIQISNQSLYLLLQLPLTIKYQPLLFILR
jgi:hypothetical protein